MSTTLDARPSTIGGIKRKAKTIGRTNQIPHTKALDIAAQQSGFGSYQHAQKALQRGQRAPLLHSIFLSAYWRDSSIKPSSSGLETLEIKLPRPLLSFFSKNQCGFAQNLQGFFVEYSDHLEMRGNANSQLRAQELLTRAALALQFVEATGLQPATTKAQRKVMAKAEELPSSDHISRWLCADTGSWLMLDEPYSHVTKPTEQAQRDAWIAANGFNWAKPEWEGLYYPGHAVPHFVSNDVELLMSTVEVVERLSELARTGAYAWAFLSGQFHGQFVSPARDQDGKKRKPRLGTTYGFSKNAIEYRRQEGYASYWRPAQRMSMENHKEMGWTLKRLYSSRTPYEAHAKISELQSELENWMFAEYRLENRDDVDVDVYYGGVDIPSYSGTAEMIGAVDHVRSIMVGTYLESKPLRDYLKKLDAARLQISNAKN
ncbi:DUF5623 domain-containing protein [Pseudomonas farris]